MTQLLSKQDSFLDQVTDAIYRRGLRLPALIALDVGRPLSFLGGQLLWISQPALSLFFPRQAVQQLAQLLEDPEAIAEIAARLEAKEI